MQVRARGLVLEIFAIIAVGGAGFSVLRVLATRMTAVPLTEGDLKERTLTHSLGVRDGAKLDVWMHPGARLPARATRLLRGRTERGRGLRLSLYAGQEADPHAVGERVVRTFMGPLPDDSNVFVEVTMRVARDGGIRLKATDKASGAQLRITKDVRRNNSGRTTLRTRTLKHDAIRLDDDWDPDTD
jgi:hypothetical protein